jgi:O-antigen/teichoic acid export membrane protein
LLTAAGTAVLAIALALVVVPVYGPGFSQTTDLGLILLPGTALLAMSAPLFAAIVGRGRPQLSLLCAGIVTPLTVILFVLLIPPFHAPGAALASSVSYATMFGLAAWFYGRVTGENPVRLMLPTRAEFADFRTVAAGAWSAINRGRRQRAGLKPKPRDDKPKA